MQSNSYRRSESVCATMIGQRTLDSDAAFDRRRDGLEGHEKPIACVIYFLSPMAREERPESLIVPPKQVFPGLVTNGLYQVR